MSEWWCADCEVGLGGAGMMGRRTRRAANSLCLSLFLECPTSTNSVGFCCRSGRPQEDAVLMHEPEKVSACRRR